jgi:hypothetical protein
VEAKHVLRYLRGMVDYGLSYVQGDEVRLMDYTNSDWAGSAVDRKSTLGCCFNLGSTIVSWFSRKQKSMVLKYCNCEDYSIYYFIKSIPFCGLIMSGIVIDQIPFRGLVKS